MDCVLDSDDLYVLSDTDTRRCSFDVGTTLRFFYFPDPNLENNEVVQEPSTDTDPGEPTMNPLLFGVAYAQEPEHEAPAEHHEAAPAEVPAAVPAAAPMETHASTQVAEPANGVPDLSQIQGLAGGNPILTVILAVILVGGGTAGWKFWNKKSEQNHEFSLKKLEMDKELAGLNGTQPPPCQAASAKVQVELDSLRSASSANEDAHKKLQAQIDELTERLHKFEKKASSMLSGGFDAEEMTERVEKLEKFVKDSKAAAKTSTAKK